MSKKTKKILLIALGCIMAPGVIVLALLLAFWWALCGVSTLFWLLRIFAPIVGGWL